MKKALLTVIFVGVFSLAVRSQQPVQSEREAMYYRYLDFASYIKGGSVQPHWMADGRSFWYEEAAGRGKSFSKVDPEANTRVALLDTARLRAALRTLDPERAWPTELVVEQLSLLSGDTVARLTVDGNEYFVRLDTYAVSKAPPARPSPDAVPRVFWSQPGWGERREEVSPDGQWLAGISDHNLYLRSTEDGRTRQLTADGEEWYEWDLKDRDFDPATSWSPDRTKLAVKKVDYRQVPEAHRPVPPGVSEYETRTELFIIDVASQRRLRGETGREAGEQMRILGWRRDGSELLYLVMDRAFKRLDLRAASATSGATRVILSERQDTFVLGWSWWTRQIFLPLEDGESFIWSSERDGWNHLYLYRLDGTLVRRLTTGKFPVHQAEAVDEREGWVYFTASGDRRRPYDRHLYRVTLEGRGFQQLTKQLGKHAVSFSPSREYYLDTHSAPDRPPVVELRRANGQLRQVLSKANADALAELKWRPPDQFVVKAADGRTDLHGLLYKPYDFDPRKRYPVVEHIYGGPHISTMGAWARLNNFLGWWGAVEAQALAQLGFIVFIVDGRGTPDRGKAFQDFGHGALGLHEILDHVTVLKGLARERPYMDLRRVGVFGHSFGGYMVLRAMLTQPDVYHVGFASDAIIELDDIRIHQAEVRGYIWWLGWLEENKDAYTRVSVLPLASNLKGKLLLSWGESYAPQASKMVNALTEARKPFDVLPGLPGQRHSLTFPPGAEARVREARRRYFQEHLKP